MFRVIRAELSSARTIAGMSVKPLILISNDDGVRALGIQALAGALADVGEVILAAPDRERSAASHSISLDHPLRVERVAPNAYAIDGTPVDCHGK